ncbi:MAG: hypothetical protein JNL01_08465 [Bdellovibrionales bacterium]|nr:hypothetical protein [Bdellovibrionales bacterium]
MRKVPLVSVLAVALFLQFGSVQKAQASHLGWNADGGLLPLLNSKKQGSNAPSGSSILTQANIFYNFPWVGYGVFVMYEWQGSVETAYSAGPKMELHYGPFFVDAGYAMLMRKNYSDRSIASDSGRGAYLGVGLRYHLAKNVDEPGVYLQITFRRRTLSTTTRDGITLSEPITQNDTYPLFSMGYAF